ncbi:MAG: sigma-70 domain-containing protein, partial [Planctomycetota bacterium]
AYSYTKIQGSILDELRKLDCVSYSGRNLANKIESGYDELYKKLGREPEIEEIAAHLNMKMDEIKEGLSIVSRLNMSGRSGFQVKDPHTGNYVSLVELTQDKSVNYDRTLLCESLKKYVKTAFSTFEQLIFTLYFESNLNLTQIAKMFDYSPSRITDIFNKMLLKLRNYLRLLIEKYSR